MVEMRILKYMQFRGIQTLPKISGETRLGASKDGSSFHPSFFENCGLTLHNEK